MKLLEITFCAGGLPREGLELCSCSSEENIGKVPVLCTSAFSFFATLTDVLQQWRHITVSQSISVSSLQLFVLSQVFVKTACMARRLILCGSGTEHTWIQRLTCSLIHIEHILWISCYWLPQKQSEPIQYTYIPQQQLLTTRLLCSSSFHFHLQKCYTNYRSSSIWMKRNCCCENERFLPLNCEKCWGW